MNKLWFRRCPLYFIGAVLLTPFLVTLQPSLRADSELITDREDRGGKRDRGRDKEKNKNRGEKDLKWSDHSYSRYQERDRNRGDDWNRSWNYGRDNHHRHREHRNGWYYYPYYVPNLYNNYTYDTYDTCYYKNGRQYCELDGIIYEIR